MKNKKSALLTVDIISCIIMSTLMVLMSIGIANSNLGTISNEMSIALDNNYTDVSVATMVTLTAVIFISFIVSFILLRPKLINKFVKEKFNNKISH